MTSAVMQLHDKIYKINNPNNNCDDVATPSLAEELFQKVKRMFGNPHQATEDLKAEVLATHNDTELNDICSCLDFFFFYLPR